VLEFFSAKCDTLAAVSSPERGFVRFAEARVAGLRAGVAHGVVDGTIVRLLHRFADSGTADELQPFGCPAGD
jgi:hypothetical protein